MSSTQPESNTTTHETHETCEMCETCETSEPSEISETGKSIDFNDAEKSNETDDLDDPEDSDETDDPEDSIDSDESQDVSHGYRVIKRVEYEELQHLANISCIQSWLLAGLIVALPLVFACGRYYDEITN